MFQPLFHGSCLAVLLACGLYCLPVIAQPKEDVLPRYLQQLNSPDKQVRQHALQVLGEFDDPRAIEALVTTLVNVKDKEEDVYHTDGYTGLVTIGLSAIPTLCASSQHPDPLVRMRIIGTLGAIASRKLHGRSDPRLVRVFMAALRDTDPRVRRITLAWVRSITDSTGELGKAVIACLHDPDKVVRDAAFEALYYYRTPEARTALLALLHDGDAEVKKAAINQLDAYKDPEVVDALLPLVKDGDAEVCEYAIDALGSFGDRRAVPALLDCLQDKQKSEKALGAIIEIGDPRGIPPLMKLITDNKTPYKSRETLPYYMAHFGSDAVQPLLDLAQHRDSTLRRLAMSGLGSLQDPRARQAVEQGLADPDKEVRSDALQALRNFWDQQTFDIFVKTIHGKDIEMAKDAIYSMASFHSSDVHKELSGLLQDPRTEIRDTTVFAISQSQDDSYLEDLIVSLHDQKLQIRAVAMWAIGLNLPRSSDGTCLLIGTPLGSRIADAVVPLLEEKSLQSDAESLLIRLHDSRVVPVLIRALYNPKTRKDAAAGLQAFPDPRAVEPLLALLKVKDQDTRATALTALAEIKDPRIVEAVMRFKADDPLRRSTAAMKIMAASGNSDAVNVVLALVRDDKFSYDATSVLSKAKEPRAIPILIDAMESPSMAKWRVMPALVSIGAPSFEPVLALLDDGRPWVRGIAATILGKLGDHRAIPALIIALKDPGRQVRAAAAEALGVLKADTAVLPLTTVLQDPYDSVQTAAAKALTALKAATPETVTALRPLLRHDDYIVRYTAATALAIAHDEKAVIMLLDGIHQSQPTIRRLSIDGLAQVDDPRADQALLGLLSNSNVLRSTVFEALAKRKAPIVIETLINSVGPQGMDWQTARALTAITGQQFRYQEEWRDWWAKEKAAKGE
ncbi:MAG: HEAT repeat domain-containing protein [Armatimonadota bacterium]